jgi:peptidoglycan/xylan/chitin deacetylase (PgdA/CDA1 family)
VGALCFSIDLDEARCYCDVHGLESPGLRASRAIHERALPRALRFFEEIGVRATWFAVGRDVEESAGAAELLREVARRGGEIGNHTHGHRYDLVRLPANEAEAEVIRGAEAIRAAVGVAPRGFRAPGYNVTAGLLRTLEALGYAYDSSIFPCPAYLAARAAAIAAKAALGKRSASVAGDPRIAMAPTAPYRVATDSPWEPGAGIAELPIAVVTRARLPFIGTSIAMAGPRGAALLARQAIGLAFVNLELHGVDFADAEGDGLTELKAHQPDLRIPLVKRLAAFERAAKTLLDAGAQPMTLLEAADRLFV